MVYTMVKKYSWKDCYVIHDDGNSWKPKGEDIFEEYGAALVSVMPHNPHERRGTTTCLHNWRTLASDQATFSPTLKPRWRTPPWKCEATPL